MSFYCYNFCYFYSIMFIVKGLFNLLKNKENNFFVLYVFKLFLVN